MNIQRKATKILSAMLMAGLSLTSETMYAATQSPAVQQSSGSDPRQQGNVPAAQTGSQAGQSQPQNPGTTVDPSRAPLQPVTTYPEAPTPVQNQEKDQGNAQPANPPAPASRQQLPKPVEPAGAAAAEKVPTTGGTAAKPAGFAIAPAKQHQTRSLLIKVGAIAAGAVAAGTIYALSHGTPSTPPGTNMPGATRK